MDSSTSLRPHMGHKVTPGLTEAKVESRTTRNRKRENLSFGSALNHEQYLPLLAGNDQLNETKVQPTNGVQPLKPFYPIGSLITPRKPQILKGQSCYREPHLLRWTKMVGSRTEARQQLPTAMERDHDRDRRCAGFEVDCHSREKSRTCCEDRGIEGC